MTSTSPETLVGNQLAEYRSRLSEQGSFAPPGLFGPAFRGSLDRVAEDLLYIPEHSDPIAAGMIVVGTFAGAKNLVALPFLRHESAKHEVGIGRHHSICNQVGEFCGSSGFMLDKDNFGERAMTTFSVRNDNYKGTYTRGTSSDAYGWLTEKAVRSAIITMSNQLPEIEFCLNVDENYWMIIQGGYARYSRTE